MDTKDDGSSTESEYYGLSEDEQPPFLSQAESGDLSGHGHVGAHRIDEEMSAEIDDERDDEDAANSTAFTSIAAEWNNILTPDLAAAVARVAVHMRRRSAAEPLAIPLDPPVETLPQSAEFVSPFAALAAPIPQLQALKEEKPAPVLVPQQPAAIKREATAVESPRPRVPARVVIDLSLDSDDDEEDEVLVRRVPTPPTTQSTATSALSTSTASVSPSQPRDTVSDIRLAPTPLSHPPPASLRPQASRRHAATTSVAPQAPPPPPPASAVKLTLSCTRCHRLVPEHSATSSQLALFDCKCCGRKYAQEELSVRGANRRCMFCKVLTPRAGAPPSSAASVSDVQPHTPQNPAEAVAHAASISPAPVSPRVAPLQAHSRPTARPVGWTGSIVSRPAPMLTPPQVLFTCVTCHQPLKARRSLASVQRELDPWFCTCCQRLLCMKDSPPDKGPIGTNPKAIPRCMCCAIAACDLDSQLEARRPHLEQLQELRRLSRLLQSMMDQLLRQLKNAKRDSDVKTIEKDPIKLEINKRYGQWRSRMLSIRGGQRRTLRRDDVTLQQQRAMFKDQLALEQAEGDVRSRLVAYLAVTLHAHRVPLPREVRGIVGDDKEDQANAARPRPKQQPTHSVRQAAQVDTMNRVKARSRMETEKARHSHGVHRRPFSFVESQERADDHNARQTSAKRHKDSRYLAYEPSR